MTLPLKDEKEKPPGIKKRGGLDPARGARRVPPDGVSLIILGYLVFAGAWFLVKDFYLARLLQAKPWFGELILYEDVLFVLVTGLILSLLVSRFFKRIVHVSDSLRSSEGKYRLLVENSPDGIYINRDNRIVYVNPAAVRLFGARDAKDLIGKCTMDLFPPESQEVVRDRVSTMLEGQSVPLVTHKILRLDGQIRDVEVAAVSFEDDEGPAIKAIFRDITERKQKDAEIQRLNRIYAVLSQINQMVVRVSSRNDLLQETCEVIVKFGGFKMAWMGCLQEKSQEITAMAMAGEGIEIIRQIRVLVSPDLPEGQEIVGTAYRENRTCITNDYGTDPRTKPWHETVAKYGYQSAITLPIHNDGEVCAVLMVCSGEKNYFHNKEIKLLEEVAMSISFALDHLDQEIRRRAAVEAQEHALSLQRATFDSSVEGIFVVNLEQGIVDFNARWGEMWQLPESWYRTRDYDELLKIASEMLENPDVFYSGIKDWAAHPEKPGSDILKFKDGRVYERYSIPQRMEGIVVGRVVTFRDVTERKRTEEALRKSEEKFVKAFHLTPAIVAIVTVKEGRYIEVNEIVEEVSGWTRQEVIGHTISELNLLEDPREAERLIVKVLTEGALRNEECVWRKKNGEMRICLVSAELMEMEGEQCIIYVALDITERKQMEEKLLRSQRMESIGALAGGMAHDLNNILAPILMSASLLREKKTSPELQAQLVAGIEESAKRGASIVNQVLTFARGVKVERTVLDTNALAGQISKLVKETFPKTINFSLSIPESIWNITGDSTQLQQVFLNLCVNARDAMPNGGILELSAENRDVDNTFAFMAPGATPGSFVEFKLKDTGCGIPKEMRDRIFEPFFTTKETGKGTGLGLSMVMGIVRSHGGFLKVESEVGKGSVFHIFLPATADEAKNVQVTPDQPTISRGHGETILVVDDEQEILQIIATALEQNGWNVITATDGVEGVAEFLNHSAKIKAVVTDMVMPNMDGLNLIRSLRKLSPLVPILISSGFSNEESRGELGELQVNGFLKKPFSARQLIAEVFSVLYGQNGK